MWIFYSFSQADTWEWKWKENIIFHKKHEEVPGTISTSASASANVWARIWILGKYNVQWVEHVDFILKNKKIMSLSYWF
jgi:hypothetical protein